MMNNGYDDFIMFKIALYLLRKKVIYSDLGLYMICIILAKDFEYKKRNLNNYTLSKFFEKIVIEKGKLIYEGKDILEYLKKEE